MIRDKINHLQHISDVDDSIIAYLNHHPEDLIHMSSTEFAKASHTSQASIVRFAKKLGYMGFTDFKNDYIKEYSQGIDQRSLDDFQIHQNAPLHEIHDIVSFLYLKTIENVKSTIDINTLTKIANIIQSSKRVEIYGTGSNYDLANMMAYRFETVNKNCGVYNNAHWEHLKHLAVNQTPTVVILLSQTGENPLMLNVAKRCRELHLKTVSISKNKSLRLKELTDYNIDLIDIDLGVLYPNMIFTLGVQYILDICISSLLAKNYTNIQELYDDIQAERDQWLK